VWLQSRSKGPVSSIVWVSNRWFLWLSLFRNSAFSLVLPPSISGDLALTYLVHSFCCNKTIESGWFINNRNLSLMVLEDGQFMIKTLACLVSGESCSSKMGWNFLWLIASSRPYRFILLHSGLNFGGNSIFQNTATP
jgi:hypothetical protein